MNTLPVRVITAAVLLLAGPGTPSAIPDGEPGLSAQPASTVYLVSETQGEPRGVRALLRLMEQDGTPFYRQTAPAETSRLRVSPPSRAGRLPEPRGQPEGIVAPDSVVLLKVNAQWDQRGGTSTDLVSSLVRAVTSHPDGFTGEVVIADNGQAQYGARGNGGSLDWKKNNARDRTQSMQDVADRWSRSHQVSTYLWDSITATQVQEYDQGDSRDGFIKEETPDPETGLIITYPKFTTAYGTPISLKKGIWNSQEETYYPEKLVLINLPVLKHHSIYGVTAAVKNAMGTASDKLTGHNAHNTIGRGSMGTQMAETRIPDLNILDAIWINPLRGPRTPDRLAVNTGKIAASTDPVALDAWAAAHILMPAAEKAGSTSLSRMDPESRIPTTFGHWLRLSLQELRDAGRPFTIAPGRIRLVRTP